ncbi:MAG: hypothetical protein KAY09_01770 [Nitrospira sp.]|nr:hypothetical protein [Nitrospira sp.]
MKKKLRGGTGRVNLFRNGMVSGASIKAINNRTWTWKWFRFSCKDLGTNRRLVTLAQKADLLFDDERQGTLHEVSSTDVDIHQT